MRRQAKKCVATCCVLRAWKEWPRLVRLNKPRPSPSLCVGSPDDRLNAVQRCVKSLKQEFPLAGPVLTLHESFPSHFSFISFGSLRYFLLRKRTHAHCSARTPTHTPYVVVFLSIVFPSHSLWLISPSRHRQTRSSQRQHFNREVVPPR